MKILGLNLGHDSSCSIMKDNQLIAACEEERYTKKKHIRQFPYKAIKDCLKLSGLKISEIDKICVGCMPNRYIKQFFIKPLEKNISHFDQIFTSKKRIMSMLNMEASIRKKLQFKKKLEFFNHHKCHLASSYFLSNFKNSILISLDGVGEIESGIFGVGSNDSLKILKSKNLFPHSLGMIYAAVTFFLGWKPFYDEGIVMGLAPYGNDKKYIPKTKETYREVFKKIITYDGKLNYKINLDWVSYHKIRDVWISENFIKTFGKKRSVKEKITNHHKNIAAQKS